MFITNSLWTSIYPSFYYQKSLLFKKSIRNILTMQKTNYQRDSPSLIMRNPYESLSWSKQSSKFGKPIYQGIEVPQFNGNHQSCPSNHLNQTNAQIQSKEMKYMYSFCNPNFNQNHILHKFNHSSVANQQIPQPQNIKEKQSEFNYSERLTFQNQSASPFVRIQPPKISQQNQQFGSRYSFNPLQNKVTQLQKLCKKLYQTLQQQGKKSQNQKNSIQRIEHKIDFLLQIFQSLNIFEKLNESLPTRCSNDHKKRTSIGQKTNQRKILSQITEKNSSQQLSRYLEAPSSEQSNKLVQQNKRHLKTNSFGTDKTKRVKPFMVNSNIENENENQFSDCHNDIIQFYYNEENKENLNISNLVSHHNHLQSHHQQISSNNYVQKMSIPEGKLNKKFGKLSKQKNQSIQKCSQDPNPHQRTRANSQGGIHKKKNLNPKKKKETQVSRIGSCPKEVAYENSRIFEPNLMQNSAIFNAVQFPNSYEANYSQIRESQSTELPRNSKKSKENRTLLESIEEKKRLIDRQISKRLMKNSSILYGEANNLREEKNAF